MTTAIIPVLAAMFLGSTFNLGKYQKGNAEVYDPKTLEGNLQVIDRSFTRSQYKLIETSTQAREFLDVDGALSLRIKKKEIEIDGSGAYLYDAANRQKFVELLIRIQHETKTETIPSHLKPKEDWMLMDPSEVGTHYVRSITYGGELIASLKLKANNREEREKIKAAVTANLQLTGAFDINANGSFDKLRKDLAGMYNEEIKIMATKSPSSPPETVEDLMKLVDNYPKEISKVNDGKGKALKAELFPLSSLRKGYPEYLPNRALTALLDDIETKYDDIRVVVRDFRSWEDTREDSSDEDEEERNSEKISEMYTALLAAQTEFNKAISKLDVSMNGNVDQFKNAFKAYGEGVKNTPNRYQRWFWKLRHEVSQEPIVIDKPDGSGITYINWGMSTCPTSDGQNVQLLYSGQVAGPLSKSWGGGRDFKCMQTSTPGLSEPLTMQPKPALLDAVEYRTLANPDKSGPIPCASCLVTETLGTQVFYGQSSCPQNWRKEYSGLTMADSGAYIDSNFMCLNEEIFSKGDITESGNAMSKLSPVWMDCQNCAGEKISPCVICTHLNKIKM